jgi:hypothetical protein
VRAVDATPRSRTAARLALGALLAAAGAVIGLAVFDAVAVARDLSAARAGLTELTAADLANPAATEARVAAAARRLASADARAHRSRWFGILDGVPGLDRQIDAARRLTTAAAQAGAAASTASSSLADVLARPDTGGGRAVALLDALVAEITAGSDALAAIDLGSDDGLVPPLRAARQRLARQRDGAVAGLARMQQTAAALRTMLDGPRTYLVLAANNAEMRAGGGMVLQAGTIRFAAGRVEAGEFRAVETLRSDAGIRVPKEIEQLYGWLGPGRDWRNTGSSPVFAATAPLYAALAEAAGMGQVDGVILVDAVALRQVIRVLGPVQTGRTRVDAANALQLLLHDLYEGFDRRQRLRRNLLGNVARATVRALDARSWPAGPMVAALERAAAGRHMLAWSRRPAEQAAWGELGVDGALVPNGLLVSVQNHGGNKLDWFLRPALDVHVASRRNGERHVEIVLQLDNPTPEGELPYIAGIRLQPDLAPGDYRAFVTAHLPAQAVNVRLEGGRIVSVGTEGGRKVVGALLDIPRQHRRTVRLDFWLPAGTGPLVLEPSARPRPMPVSAGDRRTDDARPRVLSPR